MSSTSALVLAFFSSGFAIGFGHCIGMCGPIVVSLSLNLAGRGVWGPHLLYNAGRCLTYAVLGGLMGAAGSFTGVVSHIAGLQKGVLIFAGALIAVMGLAMGGWLVPVRIFGDNCGSPGFISAGFRRLSAARRTPAYLPLGLLLGLLPCGPVYTALLGVTRAGMEAKSTVQAFWTGGLLMFAFGLGTVPALLMVARLASFGWLRARGVIYRAGAVIMVVMGVYFVVRGVRY